MTNPILRRVRTIGLGLITWACGTVTLAADYPVKPLRLIVPFAPGGSNDIMGRIVAQKFNEGMGQQVIVDNRPGASGIVGTEIATHAAPDGYTMLMMSLTLTVNPSLYRKLPYDTEKDLVPVTLVASAPLMLTTKHIKIRPID